MDFILEHSVISVLNILILIGILWVCNKGPCYQEIHTEGFKGKGRDVCNLLSNGSEKNNIQIIRDRSSNMLAISESE